MPNFREVFTNGFFFYNLQLNGKYSFEMLSHCIGKHHQIQFKYIHWRETGIWSHSAATNRSRRRLFVLSADRQVFLQGTLRSTTR